MTKHDTTQLNLFQRGEDLPLFNQPDEYPEDHLEDWQTGLPEWDNQPDEEPQVFASGFCVDDLDEGPAYPLGQCEVCGWGVDRLTLCRRCADEEPLWFRSDICQVCAVGLPPGVTLCREHAQMRIDDLDESYKVGEISWDVYTQAVTITAEAAGMLPPDPCDRCDSADDCNASTPDECERLNKGG